MPKELLFSITKKGFEIQYFSGTGAGGQHRNKHQNCVRLRHIDSGVVATGQSSRSRTDNLREAFQGLIANTKFKLWHNKKIHEILEGKTVEQKVKESMSPENLRIEVLDENNKWNEAAIEDE